ncbi:hypothetical protein ACLOJK_038026 [Asimina triloba]
MGDLCDIRELLATSRIHKPHPLCGIDEKEQIILAYVAIRLEHSCRYAFPCPCEGGNPRLNRTIANLLSLIDESWCRCCLLLRLKSISCEMSSMLPSDPSSPCTNLLNHATSAIARLLWIRREKSSLSIAIATDHHNNHHGSVRSKPSKLLFSPISNSRGRCTPKSHQIYTIRSPPIKLILVACRTSRTTVTTVKLQFS